MASQSKLRLLLGDRSVGSVVSDLTRLYLANRSRISRAVWISLFVALVNRVRHAVSEQKAARSPSTATSSARSCAC
ncbi:hypothetical protein CDD83_2771 [Cordyceps sp. RAO-2017]|nr:hypothetical protein CDD83_2771 [Cordyceps sp. RAO-2017]